MLYTLSALYILYTLCILHTALCTLYILCTAFNHVHAYSVHCAWCTLYMSVLCSPKVKLFAGLLPLLFVDTALNINVNTPLGLTKRAYSFQTTALSVFCHASILKLTKSLQFVPCYGWSKTCTMFVLLRHCRQTCSTVYSFNHVWKLLGLTEPSCFYQECTVWERLWWFLTEKG